MSGKFEALCIDHGIQRQHTDRNHPQQNGVAERSNRTMEEGVVSMLYESGMPTAFWGEALAAFIHTSNKSFTSALPDKTSHEAFYGSKPDLSRLRVWGCTAYVLIQRDKCPLGSLGSHMEKCVFIGYPQCYKGWIFYNPVTKKVVILERADFDERYFMLQRHSVPHLPPTRPDTLLETPPVISLLSDIADDVLEAPFDSQKPVHGGDGSTASDLPSAPPMSPPSLSGSVHPHTPPSTYHSLPPETPLPATPLQLTFLFHLLLLLGLSTSDVPEISGCQNNGPFQITTSCQGSQHQQLPLQMKMNLALMIPLTSSRLVKCPLPSPHPISSPSNALMQICGTQHVRKRWRLTDSMALGRLSNSLLGNVPSAPEGS
jgi:hypothetical protein